MTRIRTALDRMEREKRVQEMIEQGMSQNAMARELGVSTQAVQKFLKVRNWSTKTKRMVRPAE